MSACTCLLRLLAAFCSSWLFLLDGSNTSLIFQPLFLNTSSFLTTSLSFLLFPVLALLTTTSPSHFTSLFPLICHASLSFKLTCNMKKMDDSRGRKKLNAFNKWLTSNHPAFQSLPIHSPMKGEKSFTRRDKAEWKYNSALWSAFVLARQIANGEAFVLRQGSEAGGVVWRWQRMPHNHNALWY